MSDSSGSTTGAASPSGPSSGSSSPVSEPRRDRADKGIAIVAMLSILCGWMQGLIPDWRFALGGILLAAMPADAIGLVKWAVERRSGNGK